MFFLDIAKAGVKMKPAAVSAGRPNVGSGNGFISSPNATVPLLTSVLVRLLQRTVVDRTGLTGGFEVYFSWTPEVGEGDPLLANGGLPAGFTPERRSIFSALEEDLGLKLTSGKQQVPTVTIQSVERPGEN